MRLGTCPIVGSPLGCPGEPHGVGQEVPIRIPFPWDR